MLHRFEVALWRYWPSLMPEHMAYVDAPTAFAAVECLMRVCRLAFVAHASARALDGSIVYRGFVVRRVMEEMSEEEEATV